MGLGSQPFGTVRGAGTIPFGTSGAEALDVYTSELLAAASVLGVNAIDLAAFFTEWTSDTPPGWLSVGGAVLSTTLPAGVLSLTTTALAGSQIEKYGNPLLARLDTGIGYVAFRSKLQTAVDAQTWAAMALLNPSNVVTAVFGVIGSVSAVNFVRATSLLGAGSASLGVAIDTNWHIWRVWWKAGTIHVSIDGVEVGSFAVASAVVQKIYFTTFNGATAAVRQNDIDYVFAATERP